MSERLDLSVIWGVFGVGVDLVIESDDDGMIAVTATTDYLGISKIGLRPDDARALGQVLIQEAEQAEKSG